MSTETAGTMRSLSRAIDVLEVLSDAPKGLRLTDIAQRTELAVPTARRILATLEERGLVEHTDASYRCGIGLLFGAHAYLTSSELVLHARPILQGLASSTGLTASLFVRSRTSRVVLARVEGSNPLRYEMPVGERLPQHLGAGKALIAMLPQDELRALVAEVTPFTQADGRRVEEDAFMTTLERVRRDGFAVSENERVLDSRSVAAAIRTTSGALVGAIQITGTLATFQAERVPTIAAAVRNAADALGRTL